MRLRRRPEPDPAADSSVEPGTDPSPEPAPAESDEQAPDAPAAWAVEDVAEPTVGEERGVAADPTGAIPHDRIAVDPEPLHDPAPAGPLTLTPTAAALAAEACSKSAALWVRPVSERQHRLAWHVWHADAVHLVSGMGEQLLPSLAGEVEVAVRSKDDGSRVITFIAQGQEILPSSADWAPAVDALIAARLNAPDQEETRTRWAGGATVYRLVPVAYESLGAGDDASEVGAVRPPRIPATTVGPQPWHVGGRKRRVRGIWKRDGKGELQPREGGRR
ncbi:MAG: hypothetical protein U0Q15_11050 [Kineosporiaceae bacterium]